MAFAPIPIEVEEVASRAMECAFKVHQKLNCGLLESVYETCFAYELDRAGLYYQRQLTVPIAYDEITIESGLRLDFLVEKCVIFELKAIEKLLPIHDAQLLTYLRLTNTRLGFLLNFNVPRLKDGIRRIVN